MTGSSVSYAKAVFPPLPLEAGEDFKANIASFRADCWEDSVGRNAPYESLVASPLVCNNKGPHD